MPWRAARRGRASRTQELLKSRPRRCGAALVNTGVTAGRDLYLTKFVSQNGRRRTDGQTDDGRTDGRMTDGRTDDGMLNDDSGRTRRFGKFVFFAKSRVVSESTSESIWVNDLLNDV